ncbi:MAG TPA: hypothetical protein VLV55_11895 [Rhizomicrobium sp.]|nr:hypothetical protein [Rhizomicrobium sp.]
MRKVLVAAAGVIGPVSLAFAQGDVMTTTYGNTVVVHTDSGHEVHIYYNADHTFTGKVVDVGFNLKGTWTVDGDTLCRIYDPVPPTVTNPVCQPIAVHNIGDNWQVGKNSATLVQGIQ